MSVILVMEMRGFAVIASHLSRDMESVGVTAERVRSAAIRITNDTISQASKNISLTKKMHLGGDTWYFTFDDIEECVKFACKLLNILLALANEKGLYYIKPSMGLTTGDPKFDGERFLDDNSISAYRAADSGLPYHLFVIGEAVNLVQRFSWIKLVPFKGVDGKKYASHIIDWQNSLEDKEEVKSLHVSLPAMLLDSEVIYSHSNNEAVEHVIRQQERSSSIYAFGGPVPIDVPIYRNYLRSAIALLKNNNCKWTVLSYLPLNEAFHTYAWLEMCRRFTVFYPNNFAFAAFPIPEGQLRPFSYHIYDDNIVHIGLRSFSPQRGTSTMSSAIMFRNQKITLRFKEEFIENWRRIGSLTDEVFGSITTNISGLTNNVKKDAIKSVDDLINE